MLYMAWALERVLDGRDRRVRIHLLGPVRIEEGDVVVGVGPPQRCLVLAALAAAAGQTVPADTLIGRVWGQSPPRGAWRTLQTHIASIRGLLVRAELCSKASVVRRHGGYLLDIDPELVDLHRFRRLVAQASNLGHAAADRIRLWREAVGLWDEPMAGLSGQWLEQTRQAWCGQYREAVLGWAYAEIQAGDPAPVLGPLADLMGRYPLVEELPAMLMRALYTVGRRSDALDCYAAARQRLDDELAEKPGPELQAVYQAVLRREPDLPPPAGALPPGTSIPALLPVNIRGFVGREDHLAQLDAAAATVGDTAAAATICAVAGTAGVGKTALAVYWAHRAAKRFPHGQLYVNLRGFDPGAAALDPADAIRAFLDALGIAAQRIPIGREAQQALYRTTLADKRMLIVLDNAKDAAQVRPLLPGAPGCMVLITSRNQLTGLVAATGARCLTLDLLTPAEARDLLVYRLGAGRVAAESAAVDALITRCARLPLALALVAARAATQPHLSLQSLAAQLPDDHSRLDALADPDPVADVRTVLSASYTALTPDAARTFRLLGHHPGPDISAAAAASLAAVSLAQTRSLLSQLVTANLLIEHAPGRYILHDLLRAYATDLNRHAQAAEGHDATGRMLDHYLHTAYAADRLLNPTRDPIVLTPAQPGTTPEHPTDLQQALEWFGAEHAVLLTIADQARAAGLDTHAWQLAWALADYLDRHGHWHDQAAAQSAAVAAAERLSDQAAQALTHRTLAIAYIRLGRHDDAHTHLQRALHHANHTNDISARAHIQHVLATLHARTNRYTDALHHIRQATDLYTEAGHRPALASALNSTGWYHAQLGNHQEALGHCRQALDLFRTLEDLDGQAATWDSLGYIHNLLGHHTDAITCYQHAIDLYREVSAYYHHADSLTSLGDTHHTTGNHAAARTAWHQALGILEDLEHPDAHQLRAKLHELDQTDP